MNRHPKRQLPRAKQGRRNQRAPSRKSLVATLAPHHEIPAPSFCPGPDRGRARRDLRPGLAGLRAALKPLADAFIKLITMLISPIIFCTIVVGIGNMTDLKKVGRVGLKALITSRSSRPSR